MMQMLLAPMHSRHYLLEGLYVFIVVCQTQMMFRSWDVSSVVSG